jgi:ABC-2 type transport system permease protein/oleandomycin transport system permease protein
MSTVLVDTAIIAGRNLRAAFRIPEMLFFGLLQPVMFVVLFRYVFGGAIDTGDTSYVNFLMAGIFVQTACFAAYGTGISLAEDMARGLLDRFRSLPMVSSAVVSGRIVTDLCVQAVALLVMFVVGVLVGFRPEGGLANIVAMFALLLLIVFSFAWIGATVGLSMRSVQAVQTGGFIWLFPLTFVSSAFVPVETMPDWLQTFAERQPITRLVDAVRALALDEPAREAVLWALLWCALIIVAFIPLSIRAFQRAAVR